MNTLKKYVLYAYIKPYELKLCLAFPLDCKIRFIQEYIEDTMRNFRAKYKVGRIEHKKTSSILLPDFKIGEILEDKDELIVYSIEYGLTKKSLNDKKSIEDIDKLFIAKKTKRESKVTSRKISIDASEKNENKNVNGNKYEDKSEIEEDEENGYNNEDGEEKETNNGFNLNKDKKDNNSNYEEEYFKKNNNKKNKVKKNVKKDNSSNSGDDDSEDIKL